MRLLTVILACVALLGCSHKLCHPTKTQEEFRQEDYACQKEASERLYLMRIPGNPIYNPWHQLEYDKCMEQVYGWRDCRESPGATPAVVADAGLLQPPGSGERLPATAPEQVGPRVYTHTVRQAFGGAQSPDDARVAAMARAKRDVLEKVGTYLESLTEVREGQVARDEILALAAGVLRAEVVSEKSYADGLGGFGVEVTARVEVDPGPLKDRVSRLLSDREAWSRVRDLEARERKLLKRLAALEAENNKLAAGASAPESLKKEFKDTTLALQAGDFVQAAWELWEEGEGEYKEPVKAVNLLSEAIMLDPENAFSYNLRGIAYSNLGRYDEALQDYSKAINLSPDFSWAYENRAMAYVIIGQCMRAIEDYNHAIGLNPRSRGSYFGRGDAYECLGQYEEAVRDYSKVISLDPKDALAYRVRARAYAKLGQMEESGEDFVQSFNLDPWIRRDFYNHLYPEGEQAYYDKGVAHFEKREYDLAIQDFTKVIQIAQNSTAGYTYRCLTYLQIREYKQAIDDCSWAIKLNPNLPPPYFPRGVAYIGTGQYGLAVQDLDQVVCFTPSFDPAYSMRGEAYLRWGQNERALEDFSRAIKLNPKNYKAYHGRGTAYHFLHQDARAIEDFTRAIAISPTTPNSYNSRGLAYLFLKDEKSGCRDLEIACRLGVCSGIEVAKKHGECR